MKQNHNGVPERVPVPWSRGERLSRDDDVLRPSAPRALTPAAAAAARLGERRSRFRALARAALAAAAAADLDADDAVGVRGLPADELRPRFDADADAEERPLFLLAGRLSFNCEKRKLGKTR